MPLRSMPLRSMPLRSMRSLPLRILPLPAARRLRPGEEAGGGRGGRRRRRVRWVRGMGVDVGGHRQHRDDPVADPLDLELDVKTFIFLGDAPNACPLGRHRGHPHEIKSLIKKCTPARGKAPRGVRPYIPGDPWQSLASPFPGIPRHPQASPGIPRHPQASPGMHGTPEGALVGGPRGACPLFSAFVCS